MTENGRSYPLVGGIETGGTKFNCAIGRGPEVLSETRIPTTTPKETIGRVISWFGEAQKDIGRIEAVGIGSFGPIDLHPKSKTFGWILQTPKPGWQGTSLVQPVRKALDVPVVFDTDVNAAAYGEWWWGAAKGLESFTYLTIGTGIGGGGMINGGLMHGLTHPEMGHVRIPHDDGLDPFAGTCPYHGDCFEGLASGEAIRRRWNTPAEQLPSEHPAWVLEADYIAAALNNYIMTLSPQRIILGGGVMQQKHLFPRIRTALKQYLAGYIADIHLNDKIDQFVVSPRLGQKAGLIGACALAGTCLER